MSLCDLIVQPKEAAYLITDSGTFNLDGTIHALASKEILLPGVPVAITATGRVGTLFDVVKKVVLGVYEDPAEFTMPRLLSTIRLAYDQLKLDPEALPARWLAAYYSREAGFAHGFAFATNTDGGKPGVAPFTWYSMGLSLMPSVSPKDLFEETLAGRIADPAAFDVPKRAMQLVRAQRERRPESSGGVCVAAGQIRLTKVSAAGVEQEVLHEYPDVVGQLAAA